MRRLFLLRHAKSSWQTEGQDDFDRPLNARGRKAGPLMGAYIAEHGTSPDLILCSTACRARQTLSLILPFLAGEATIHLEDALYLASSDRMLARLVQAEDSFERVMIIAHNPGLQDLTLSLAEFGADLETVRNKFPTAALAQIDFDIDSWAAAAPREGILTRFVTPRGLAGNT